MVYELTHFLQNKLPFIWEVVEWGNSTLFQARYGRKDKSVVLEQYPGFAEVQLADVPALAHGYADKLTGDDRDVLKLRPGITGPATLKYRLEDEMIAEYVADRQAAGDARDSHTIAEEYNDKVIYPDKVRLNCYYYRHYSFLKDIRMILCTVLGRKMEYAGEVI